MPGLVPGIRVVHIQSRRPPLVGFSSESRKDSVAFAEEIDEFVCKSRDLDLRHAMNTTLASFPRGINEMCEAGASAMSLVFAAHALGFAANWITEWYAYDRRTLEALGVAADERIAGFVHIGTPAQQPEDRPRPPLQAVVTRYTA